MIKLIIFDMDGVIINSEPHHEEVNKKIFREIGIDVYEEQYKTFIGSSSLKMWEKLIKENKLDYLPEDLLKKQNLGNIKFLEDNYFEAIDGIQDILTYCTINNLKTAVASSSPMNEIKAVLKKLSIEKNFNTLVSGTIFRNSKPDPEIFLHTAHLLNIQPCDSLVIEDSENGTIAAKRAGMKCIGFINPDSGNQNLSNASYTVNSLHEVISVLEVLNE